MQVSETKKQNLKYHIYEGTIDSHDETYRFATKREAIRYAKGKIALQEQLGINWIAHVLLSKGCLFVESFSTSKYQDAADQAVRETVAKRKFQAAETTANEIFSENKEPWLLCASAIDNAIETAVEHGYKSDAEGTYPEFYTIAVGSLESLLSDNIEEHDSLRVFFAQFNIRP